MWDIESVLFEYKSKIFPYNIPVRKYDLFSFKVGANSFLVGFIQQYNNLLFIFINLVSYVYSIGVIEIINSHTFDFLLIYKILRKKWSIRLPLKKSIHPFFDWLCI